jgi:hypothetical protein
MIRRIGALGIQRRSHVIVVHRLSTASGNRPSTKRERRRRILAARHTAPAEGVPSLANALIKCCAMARINYGNNGAF